jgi:hypothetical protein
MYFLCLTFVNSIKLRYIFEDPVRSIQFFFGFSFQEQICILSVSQISFTELDEHDLVNVGQLSDNKPSLI